MDFGLRDRTAKEVAAGQVKDGRLSGMHEVLLRFDRDLKRGLSIVLNHKGKLACIATGALATGHDIDSQAILASRGVSRKEKLPEGAEEGSVGSGQDQWSGLANRHVVFSFFQL